MSVVTYRTSVDGRLAPVDQKHIQKVIDSTITLPSGYLNPYIRRNSFRNPRRRGTTPTW